MRFFTRRIALWTLVGVFSVALFTTLTISIDFVGFMDHLSIEATPSLNEVKQKKAWDERLVICAISKNATRYLEEWLDYHIALGFDHIYLYDNSDDFDINPFLEKYPGKSKVTAFHMPGWRKQITAYRACGKVCNETNVTRVLFTDVDEFLVLKQHRNIHDFCRTYNYSVVINNQVFGTSGHKSYLPLPVTMRFRCMRESSFDGHFAIKSFLRMEDLRWQGIFNPHRFPLMPGAQTFDLAGRRHYGQNIFSAGTWRNASIYHIYSRSDEEYVDKMLAGDAYYGRRNGFNKSVLYPLGTIYDDTLWRNLQRLVPKYLKYDDHALAKNLTWSCLPMEEKAFQQSEMFSNK